MNGILVLKDRIDDLYNRVVNGGIELIDEVDSIILEILKYDDLSSYDSEEAEQIVSMIGSFIEKINLMYELLDIKRENLFTLEYLEDEFKKLELKKFNIENSYIMGILNSSSLNSFKDDLFKFRNMLYAIPITEDNLLKIARMKSKIQHFNTYVLEDEDILNQAYKNDN